jgi:MoaA/NifB/PqqE/SkfB family radical SAM enzyme
MILQKIIGSRGLVKSVKTNRFLYETAQGLRSWAAYRSRKIYSVTMFITSRCNSRCKMCHIWQKQPKEDLAPETIARILKSKSLSRTVAFVVAGGEPLLHPQIDRVLDVMKGRKYRISTNGLMPEKIEEIVARHGVKEVDFSLDGIGATYAESRGVDGAKKVVESIERIKEKAFVTVVYTFSPFNGGRDFEAVKELCERLGVRLAPNIYSTTEYGDSHSALESIPALAPGNGIKNPFLLLYNSWLKGEVSLPCLSLRSKTVVYPNGDVSLCQVMFRKIGNVVERSLDEIWRDPATRRLQDEFARCNDCWIACNRENDVHMMRFLSRFVSRERLRKKYGLRGLDRANPASQKT